MAKAARRSEKAARRPEITVCLLSPHPAVLDDFRGILARGGFRVQTSLLQFAFGENLQRQSIPKTRVYVLDIHAPPLVTEGVLADLRERSENSSVLAIAESFGEASAFGVLRLGAKGLLTYADARRQLPEAVRAIAAGGLWVPRKLLAQFVDSLLDFCGNRRRLAASGRLSRREKEVMDGLLENLSNKEIAGRLNISERTAKYHVSRLLTKFGVRRRADLILLSFQGAAGARPS